MVSLLWFSSTSDDTDYEHVATLQVMWQSLQQHKHNGPWPGSKSVASTAKRLADGARSKLFNDAFNTGVCAGSEEQKTGENNDDVETHRRKIGKLSRLGDAGAVIGASHAEVGNAPEDEAEE